jgi:hypothetical protein
MSQTIRWWLASALAIVVLGGVLLLDFSSLRAPPTVFSGEVIALPVPSAMCNPVVLATGDRGCAAAAGGRSMRLQLRGDVRPLRPFELVLSLPPEVKGLAAQASVDFMMVGMDMGVNRYTLMPQPNGDFQGKVILPVCSIGRSDWVAKLSVVVSPLNAPATMWTADFPFTAEPSVIAHD